MLYALAFDRVGMVACDLYFVDPDPEPGQEGAEQGARLEVRLFERGELRGGIYSAQPIAVERPIWRADLLESVANPGSLDRAHYHPRFSGWEPGPRRFVPELTADPVVWLGRRLSDLEGLLEEAGAGHDVAGRDDAGGLRDAVPEILVAVHRLLERARAEGARRSGESAESARVGWL